jgi:hypothetical protein
MAFFSVADQSLASSGSELDVTPVKSSETANVTVVPHLGKTTTELRPELEPGIPCYQLEKPIRIIQDSCGRVAQFQYEDGTMRNISYLETGLIKEIKSSDGQMWSTIDGGITYVGLIFKDGQLTETNKVTELSIDKRDGAISFQMGKVRTTHRHDGTRVYQDATATRTEHPDGKHTMVYRDSGLKITLWGGVRELRVNGAIEARLHPRVIIVEHANQGTIEFRRGGFWSRTLPDGAVRQGMRSREEMDALFREQERQMYGS